MAGRDVVEGGEFDGVHPHPGSPIHVGQDKTDVVHSGESHQWRDKLRGNAGDAK
jgi:hypothetical protein